MRTDLAEAYYSATGVTARNDPDHPDPAAYYRFTAGPDGLAQEQVDGAIREWYTPECMAISRARDIAVVAELDGQVVGLAATRDNILQAMFVDPPSHRKGVGSALRHHAEQTAAARGHSTLRVKTTQSSLPFYSAMGMHQIRTYKPKAGAFAGKTVFILEKRIEPQAWSGGYSSLTRLNPHFGRSSPGKDD